MSTMKLKQQKVNMTSHTYVYVYCTVPHLLEVFCIVDLSPYTGIAVMVAQLVEHSAWTAECRGFESHPGQLFIHFRLSRVP